METTETSIHIYFASLEDPRVVGRCDHELLDILTVALLTNEVDWYTESLQWKGLKSLIMIEGERQEGEKTSKEKRYYISSVKESAASLLGKIRGHWSVENELHWGWDVSFEEDGSRVGEGNGAENLSLLRTMALMILKREKGSKRGVAAKRKRAGWDPSYLAKVLTKHLLLF